MVGGRGCLRPWLAGLPTAWEKASLQTAATHSSFCQTLTPWLSPWQLGYPPVVLPPPQAQYLLRNEGLFVGSSAAMNCVGAVKAARQLGPGHTIVTVLCDGGHRHLSKFHSPPYLARYELTPAATGRGLDFVA